MLNKLRRRVSTNPLPLPLPFPLVADTSGAVQKAYHVPNSIWGSTKRVSFLVGPDGKIAKVFPDVDPGVHEKELLGVISEMKAKH